MWVRLAPARSRLVAREWRAWWGGGVRQQTFFKDAKTGDQDQKPSQAGGTERARERWLRWRLSTGLGLEVARRGLRALTRLGVFLNRVGVDTLAGLDRQVLEGFLAGLHAELAGRQRHGDQLGQLNSFLTAIRTHHWDGTLPATALVSATTTPSAPNGFPGRWPST